MNAHALFSISPMEIMNKINERFEKRESEHRLIHWMLQWQWVCLCGKGWGNSHNNRWHCYETCSTLFVLCVCFKTNRDNSAYTNIYIQNPYNFSNALFPIISSFICDSGSFQYFLKFIHIRYFSYIIICSQYFSQNEYKILMPFIHFNLLVFE